MNEHEERRVGETLYDDRREDTLRDMIATFYDRKMRSVAMFVWIVALVFVFAAIFCAIQFLDEDRTKYQIMDAALFVCFVQIVGHLKIFAWQMIHRHSIKREIKRLELRIAELAERQGG